MVIRYKANRSDIWHAYWYTWRHSIRMNVLRLLLFGWVFFVAQSWLQGVLVTPVWRLSGAFVVASLAMLLLAVYPLLRFKREERALTISTTGIATTIGKLSGDLPWGKIALLAPVGARIYIVGKNGNSFAIPRSAFGSDPERAEFLRRATEWWNEARRSNKPLQPTSSAHGHGGSIRS
jgi:hypothetical protein